MGEHTKTDDNTPIDSERRKFLNTAALVSLAGAGVSVGLASCNKSDNTASSAGESGKAVPAMSDAGEFGKYEVPPGKLDDYYMFSSGGDRKSVV